MEDIVQIRLLFVAALLVMAGVLTLLAYAIERLGERLRTGRARASRIGRRTVKHIPVRGTR
jgi:hypothetical protein